MALTTLDQRMLGLGTSLTDHTIVAGDIISFADSGASNVIKRDTVQGILDLAGGGGYELLSATTCSGTASVALESMEAGYHYRLIAESLVPASNNIDLHVRLGTSGPSYSSSGYQYVVGGYNGTSGTKETSTSAAQFRVIGQGGGTTTGEQLFVDINILNPALATARTHLYGNVGGKVHDTNMLEQNFQGFRSTAEANTAVKIYFASANIATGKVYFYRIANA